MSTRPAISSMLLAFALALAASSGCGDSPPTDAGSKPDRSASPPSAPPAPAPPAPAPPVPVLPPVEPADAPQPPATSPPPDTGSRDAAAGEVIYAQNCATCHGMRGAGDGPVGAALKPPPARHDDGAYMNALSDQHLFQVIKFGGVAVGKSPLMAPWGATLTDEQIGDVIAFVRSLAKPAYPGPKP